MRGILVALPFLLAPTLIEAAESNLPDSVSDPRAAKVGVSDPMNNYYGNTYSCYHPGMAECHHWWNADGNEIYFSIGWQEEGIITMKIVDGPHSSFVANGQWCSHNARTAAGRSDGTNYEAIDPKVLNNNMNGCQPIVDAQPGDHWYKLHLNGYLQDDREQYVLLPGHQ